MTKEGISTSTLPPQSLALFVRVPLVGGRITYQQLVNSLQYATQWLGVYREEINALNVYPVPDGDTGTNMHLTLLSMADKLQEIDNFTASNIARAIAQGSLFGARGNSGVILSQFLKGFAEEIVENVELNGVWLNRTLKNAAKTSYEAVMKPTEGTILTIAKSITEVEDMDFINCLQKSVDHGWQTLAKTPEMLPILKQAGVVDAGGQGLLRFLEGILAYFQQKPLPEAPKIQSYAAESFATEEFGYCTEFLLRDVETPVEKIRQLVSPFGESLLVVEAEGFVKGHIHTDEPDALLATVGRYGRMIVSKVEDMSEQHNEILNMHETVGKKIGLVAVASGPGIIKSFRSFGARVVNGGQTKNPSVDDLLAAINSLEAPEIILLPNNKNVIMAAKKAASIAEKKVYVVETKTIGQGLSAALNFNESLAVDELIAEMKSASDQVITFEITKSVRDVEINGKKIKVGHFIGLKDEELIEVDDSAEQILLDLINKFYENQEILTVFVGPNVNDARLISLQEQIKNEFPQISVELHQGGPEFYDYLATLE